MMVDKKYQDSSYGYRGMHSESETAFPVYYGDNKPTRPQKLPGKTLFTREDLASYNLASIRVLPISDSPKDDPVFNAKGSFQNNKDTKVTNEYIGFILVQVQEQHNEKYETVPLAGDSFASFFYGAQPATYTFAGVALNTTQDNWRDSLEVLYADYIRGSSSVRNRTVVQLKYDQRIVTGFISSFSQAIDSNTQSTSNFQLSVVVTDIHYLNPKSQDRTKLITNFSSELNLATALGQTNLRNKLLNSDRLNAVKDYSRTGFIVPPPAPPKLLASSKKRAPNCVLRPPIKDDGSTSETKDKVISTNLADTTCSGIDGRISITNQYHNAVERYKKNLDKLKNSSTDTEKNAAQVEIESARNDLTKSKILLQSLDDPNSEEAKALQDQTIDELTSNEKLQQAVTNNTAANNIGIASKVAGDKTIIPVVKAKELFVEGITEESKRTSAHIVNSIAAQQVLKSKYTTGKQAEDVEIELEKQMEEANAEAEKRSKARANKDRKEIEILE